jgi:A/G-specific adenine glycosylase
LICPWLSRCEARKQNDVTKFPRLRPRRQIEMWSWTTTISIKRGKVAMVLNDQGPVLKGQWIFPGSFEKLKRKPKSFDAKHGITHHDLFLSIQRGDLQPKPNSKLRVKWVDLKDVEAVNPSKILRKALDAALENK